MSNDTHGTRANGVTNKLVTLGAALLAGLFTVTAQAFPELDLEVGTPDLFSAGITVDYQGDNNGGTLTAMGFASTLEGFGNIDNGTFLIDMTSIDFNDQTAAGTLTIGGNGGTLLTGTLSSSAGDQTFGGNGDTGALEFLFNVTGGDVADLYGGVGGSAGIILSQSGFNGSFASAFGTQWNALANTFGQGGGVPIPGTLWLVLAGAGLLISRRQNGMAAGA
jgi:hypothetical protein